MSLLGWLMMFGMVCAAIIVHMLASAPEGYQDHDGFHYGKPPKGWVDPWP